MWASKIDKEAELIHNGTIRALDKACPKSTARSHVKIGWWSQELHKLKKQTRVNQHKMNQTPNESNTKRYKGSYKDYTKILRQAKRQHFQAWSSGVKNYKELSQLNKTLQGESNN
jgi:hypothetical protein